MLKVGIALATYNPNISFLKEQIGSLKAQTFSNWECAISDDSTDSASIDAIKALIREDARFHYIKNLGRSGVLRNFENALTQLDPNCDFFCFCDQDDVWEAFKLERMIENMERHPHIQLAHSDLSLINEAGELVSESCWQTEKRLASSETDLLHLAIRNNVTGCALMFRRGLLGMALPFPETTMKEPYLHDHWLAMLAQSQDGVLDIFEPLVRYRQHSANVVGAQKKEFFLNSRILKKIPSWKEKCVNALRIRRQLGADLVARINMFDAKRSQEIEKKLKPLLECSSSFFLKESFHQYSQSSLWLGLFLGSLVSSPTANSRDQLESK